MGREIDGASLTQDINRAPLRLSPPRQRQQHVQPASIAQAGDDASAVHFHRAPCHGQSQARPVDGVMAGQAGEGLEDGFRGEG